MVFSLYRRPAQERRSIMSFFSWLRKQTSKRVSGRRRPNWTRLLVEQLESRVVPTVVIDPHFAKMIVSDSPYTVLKDSTIYLIFWGTNFDAGETPGPAAVS